MFGILGLDANMLAIFMEKNVKLKNIKTITATGTYTFNDLSVMSPVLLLADTRASVASCYSMYTVEHGSTFAVGGGSQILGRADSIRTHTNVIIPTETSVKINVSELTGGIKIHVFVVE